MTLQRFAPHSHLVLDETETTTDSALYPARDEGDAAIQSHRLCSCPRAADQGCMIQKRVFRKCKMQRNITEPLLSQALHLFLSDTVLHLSGCSFSRGHFVELPTLVQLSSRSEALPPALEAVALASLAVRFHNSKAQSLAVRRYSTAVHRLRMTFATPELKVSNVVACILLLSIYEVCTER